MKMKFRNGNLRGFGTISGNKKIKMFQNAKSGYILIFRYKNESTSKPTNLWPSRNIKYWVSREFFVTTVLRGFKQYKYHLKDHDPPQTPKTRKKTETQSNQLLSF